MKQNLMTVELVASINNKLNSSINNIQDKIQQFNSWIESVNKNENILEKRIERLEQYQQYENWLNYLYYDDINGTRIKDLSICEKIFYLGFGFYEKTCGNLNLIDIRYVRKALDDVRLSEDEKITYLEFVNFICANPELYKRYIFVPNDLLIKLNRDDILLKSALITGKIIEEEHEAHKKKTDFEFIIRGINNELNKRMSVNLNTEINASDMLLEFILSIKMVKDEINIVLDNEDFEHADRHKLLEYSEFGIEKAEEALEKLLKSKLDFTNMPSEKIIDYAVNGNYSAQKHRADTLYFDRNRKEDAEKWYLKACESGEAEYEHALGDFYYFEGKYEQALKWYVSAGEKDYAKSMTMCGEMYYEGLGMKKPDKEEAEKWYRKSYEIGDSEGSYRLGKYYEENYPDDIDKIIEYYYFAAEKGNNSAQYSLAMIYMKNEAQYNYEMEQAAVELLKSAAEGGNDKAQYELGCYYDRENDMLNAKRWLQKAIDNKNDRAQLYMESLNIKKSDIEIELKLLGKKYKEKAIKIKLNLFSNAENELRRIKINFENDIIEIFKKHKIDYTNVRDNFNTIYDEIQKHAIDGSLAFITGIGFAKSTYEENKKSVLLKYIDRITEYSISEVKRIFEMKA